MYDEDAPKLQHTPLSPQLTTVPSGGTSLAPHLPHPLCEAKQEATTEADRVQIRRNWVASAKCWLKPLKRCWRFCIADF